MIALIFLTLLGALTAVYALFLHRVGLGLRWLAADRAEQQLAFDNAARAWPAVAVIVPMRDEEANVDALVASLRAQEYGGMLRILIVDDASRDATHARAEAACAGDERFTVMTSTGEGGKKRAIEAAVHAVDCEVILTTDADCRHDRHWVRAMVALFDEGVDVVAGPVLIDDRTTMFARLQALEFLGLIGVGAGLIGTGYPRLCNGANFAYRRDRFLEAGGYATDLLASGDDEFLMQTIVYRLGGRAGFSVLDEAVVRTPPASGVRSFLHQRTRWAGKGLHYSDRSFVSFLVLLFIYMLFVAVVPFLPFVSGVAAGGGFVLLLLKWILDARVLVATAALLRAPIRIADLLLAELLHAPYLVVASLAGVTGLGAWKDRPLKRHHAVQQHIDIDRRLP